MQPAQRLSGEWAFDQICDLVEPDLIGAQTAKWFGGGLPTVGLTAGSPVVMADLPKVFAQAVVGDDALAYWLPLRAHETVSVMYALAPQEASEAIDVAVTEAGLDAAAWVEQNMCLARSGLRQKEAAAFGIVCRAHTSSTGGPDLRADLIIYSHGLTTGTSSRLRPLDPAYFNEDYVEAATERFFTRLEAAVTSRIGVRFITVGQDHPSPAIGHVASSKASGSTCTAASAPAAAAEPSTQADRSP